jgi:hypothetical protein
MPVTARRLIRKMRGGAQAHLLEASDGHFYVVKFHNNPQHRRILVNEWVASTFLHYLGVSAPEFAIVDVTGSFLASDPEVHIQLGRERKAVSSGWHFGSRFPGDPLRTVVYDFVPDALLESIENLPDFRAVLAFDKWMGNADSRQAIFYRAQVLEPVGLQPSPGRRLGFVAQMIDNGYVFEGPHWRFGESAIQGLYFRPQVYRAVRGLADFQPWLDRIRNFPEEVIDQAVKRIPPAWLEGDEDELERLLERLMRRRERVPDLIEQCRSGRVNPFPNWRP